MSESSRSSLVEDVYDGLAQHILAISSEDDQWLPTTQELSTKYGVSRTVMREAINRLELQGLVDVRHGVGLRASRRLHKPVMASLSLLIPDLAVRLRQAMAARFLIEVEIARLAASRMDGDGLRQLLEAQSKLAAPEVTVEEAVEADTDFHQTLANHCGNDVLKLMLESIVELCRESRKLTIARTGFKRPYLTHQAVVEAVARRDGDGAAEAMRKHLAITETDLTEQLEEQIHHVTEGENDETER